ncbi:MAG: hypothetical protein WCO78_01775 [Candidatus Roizmanbacteria bacterium]
MKQLLTPIILITVVVAIGIGYYVINHNLPDSNQSQSGVSISPTAAASPSTSSVEKKNTTKTSITSAIIPTVAIREVNIDDLGSTINALDLSDLNDTMSDLQTQ